MRLPSILLLVATSIVAQTPEPTDGPGWLNAGIQAYRGARYSEAIEDFRKTVELDPSNINAHMYLANAYVNQYVPGGDSRQNIAYAEQARAEFQRVLELSPNDKTALASLASLSYNEAQGMRVQGEKLRKFDESRYWNQRLLAVDPQAKEAHYTLAVIGWHKWYTPYMEARARLSMQPGAPGPLPSMNERLQLDLDYGQILADAIANLDKALAIDPKYDDAMSYMSLLIRQRADLRDSLDGYKQDIFTAHQWIQKSLDTKRFRAQNGISASSDAPSSPAPLPGGFGETPQPNNLLQKVDPVYPPLAKQAGVEGTVRFTAIIGKDGHVNRLQLVSGHPLLVRAAQEAVEQWVYRPTLLNGQPVEVVTQVDVTFTVPLQVN